MVAERRTRTEREPLRIGEKADEITSYGITVPDWPSEVTGQRGMSIWRPSAMPVADVVRETGAAAWVAELDALNEQRRIAAKSNHERQLAEKKAQYEAGTKVLRNWAEANAEAHAIVEGRRGNWVRKLENLWIESNVPDGHNALNPAILLVDNDEPTPTDLEAMKVAQSVCDGIVVSDAQLAFSRAVKARPDNVRSMVGIVVTAPTGHSRKFWRRVAPEV